MRLREGRSVGLLIILVNMVDQRGGYIGEDIAGGGSSRYHYCVWSLHIFFYIIMNNELRINITGVVYQEGGGVQFTCVYV